jgi:hypothetical protein
MLCTPNDVRYTFRQLLLIVLAAAGGACLPVSWASGQDSELDKGLASLRVVRVREPDKVVLYAPTAIVAANTATKLNLVSLGEYFFLTGTVAISASTTDIEVLETRTKAIFGQEAKVQGVTPKQFDLSITLQSGEIVRVRELAEGNSKAIPVATTISSSEVKLGKVNLLALIEWKELVNLAGVKVTFDFAAIYAQLGERVGAGCVTDDALEKAVPGFMQGKLLRIESTQRPIEANSPELAILTQIVASEIRKSLLTDPQLSRPSKAAAGSTDFEPVGGGIQISYRLKDKLQFETLQSQLELNANSEIVQFAVARGSVELP